MPHYGPAVAGRLIAVLAIAMVTVTLRADMGQPITVTEKPTAKEGIVRFELNRSLTGMGHERYFANVPFDGDRPPDAVARLLFERPGVAEVHVYSNEITVVLAPGATTTGVAEAIESLFIHYKPGVQPTIIT